MALVVTPANADTCDAYGAPMPGVVDGVPIGEASGIAASRSRAGVFFTHDDAGGSGEQLYAFTLAGDYLGSHGVDGTDNVDWEDLAAGPCPRDGEPCLYIADIGDNNAVREEIVVYVVREPEPDQDAKRVDRWRATYPGGPRDAETLLVHPCTGAVHVVTKDDGPTAQVFAFPQDAGHGTDALAFVATVTLDGVDGGITGGSWDADGDRVVLRTEDRLYEWVGDPNHPDAHWGEPPTVVATVNETRGEGVTYGLDGDLVTVAETQPLELNRIPCEAPVDAEGACVFEPRGCGCRTGNDAGASAAGAFAALTAMARARRRARPSVRDARRVIPFEQSRGEP